MSESRIRDEENLDLAGKLLYQTNLYRAHGDDLSLRKCNQDLKLLAQAFADVKEEQTAKFLAAEIDIRELENEVRRLTLELSDANYQPYGYDTDEDDDPPQGVVGALDETLTDLKNRVRDLERNSCSSCGRY